jgi:hypothetical protein
MFYMRWVQSDMYPSKACLPYFEKPLFELGSNLAHPKARKGGVYTLSKMIKTPK